MRLLFLLALLMAGHLAKCDAFSFPSVPVGFNLTNAVDYPQYRFYFVWNDYREKTPPVEIEGNTPFLPDSNRWYGYLIAVNKQDTTMVIKSKTALRHSKGYLRNNLRYIIDDLRIGPLDSTGFLLTTIAEHKHYYGKTKTKKGTLGLWVTCATSLLAFVSLWLAVKRKRTTK